MFYKIILNNFFSLNKELLNYCIIHEDPNIRFCLSKREFLPEDIQQALCLDDNFVVVWSLSCRKNLSFESIELLLANMEK